MGFQWVTEAKARGARVIHVDPRFTRTSAVADRHIAIRVGSDVVLLGGLINHVLTHDRWFHEYVVAYTNAATLIGDEYRDTEDLGGLFSGFDPRPVSTTRRPGRTTPTARRRRRRRKRRRLRQPGGDPHHGSTLGEPAGDEHRSGGPHSNTHESSATRPCSIRGPCSRS